MSDRLFSDLRDGTTHDGDRGAHDLPTPLVIQTQRAVIRGNGHLADGRPRLAVREFLAAWRALPVLAAGTPDVSSSPNASDDELLATDLCATLNATASHLLRQHPRYPMPVDAGGNIGTASAYRSPGQPRSIAGPTTAYGATLAHLHCGDIGTARNQAAKAARGTLVGNLAKGDVSNLQGVIALIDGEYASAQHHLRQALALYRSVKLTDAEAAAQYNLGAAALLAGEYQRAGELLASVANVPFLDLSWQLSRSTLPGVLSVAITMGSPGIPLMVRALDGAWTKVSSAKPPPPNSSIIINRPGGACAIDLERSKQSGLAEQLLRPRVQAKHPQDLDIDLLDPRSFVAHLAHVQAFMLPLSLGEAFFALGDFQRAEPFFLKARDYPYLNRTIERPHVWRRLAATYLAWGRSRLHVGKVEEAEELVAKVAELATQRSDRRLFASRSVPAPRLTGPLYSGAFADIEPVAREFLLRDDPLEPSDLDHEARILLLEAEMLLDQIAAGGAGVDLSPSVPPAIGWQRLQTAADSLDLHRDRIEQIWLDVKAEADRDEYSRHSLERIVAGHEHAHSAVAEWAELAEIDRSMVRQCAAYASERRSFLSMHLPHDAEAASAVREATALAWTKAARRPAPPSSIPSSARTLTFPAGHRHDASSPGAAQHHATYRAEQAIAEIRTHFFEEAREEMDAYLTSAEQSATHAIRLRAIAALRLQWAQAQLAEFEAASCEPGPRSLALRSLRQASDDTQRLATTAASLATRTRALELDGKPWSSRDNRAERPGLSGDVGIESVLPPGRAGLHEPGIRLPFALSFSLAQNYPHEFSAQLWTAGRLSFATALDEIERQVPGGVAATVKHVEVELVLRHPLSRCHVTLTHAGISQSRDRNDDIRLSLHGSRTALVPVVGEGDQNEPATSIDAFAGLPAASEWMLRVAPTIGSSIDLSAIADVRVTVHGEALASAAPESRPDTIEGDPVVWETAFFQSLGARAPHEFALFSTTGTAGFTIDASHSSAGHAEARLTNLIIVADSPSKPLPAGLVITVIDPSGDTTVDQVVDERGLVATNHIAAPINALLGLDPLGRWTVRIDRLRNAEIFAAGFRWSNIGNIAVIAEYDSAQAPQGSIDPETPVNDEPEPARPPRRRMSRRVA